MTTALVVRVGRELAQLAPAMAQAFARSLAPAFEGAGAVLFYGSALRTGDRDGVLDFYVLNGASPHGLSGVASRTLWPDVSYREIDHDGVVLRAKIASMTLAQFQRAARGEGLDTTIWARFVQPTALVWTDGPATTTAVVGAVADAAKTAARFAAALGPSTGSASAFWQALFQATYAAEFRVEAPGRARTILDDEGARYEAVLRDAWTADGIAFDAGPDGALTPHLSEDARRASLRAWRLRRRLGRPLNIARLAKAAFTFEGAARYAAWKIERHTGLAVPVTPWRERHPLLAAPGVAWQLWKARQPRRD